jgi:hypothetical protein
LALPAVLVVAGFMIVLWGLAVPLSQGLRSDEATSLFRYIAGGPGAIWGIYIPNDHMLFEVLTWALRRVTGDRTEAVVRFWSVLPALGAVGILTWYVWRRLDKWVAAVFIALAAAAPLFLDLGMEGRGYGLAFLASALMLIGADRARRTGEPRALAVFALGGSIGIWSLPVFVLAFVATAALLWMAGTSRRAVAIAVGAVGLASLAFYAPVLGQLITSSGQKDGRQLGLTGFIIGPLQDQLQPSVQTLLHSVNPATANAFASHITSNWTSSAALLPDLLGAAAALTGILFLSRRGARFLAALTVVPIVVSYLVIEVTRLYVISRFLSFLLLPFLILCAAGIVGAGRAAARTRTLSVIVAVAGAAFCVFALERGFQLTRVAGVQQRSVVTNDPAAFVNYLAPGLMSAESPTQMRSLACSGRYAFTFLEFRGRGEPAQVDSCLRARSANLIATFHVAVNGHVVPADVWAVARSRSLAQTP